MNGRFWAPALADTARASTLVPSCIAVPETHWVALDQPQGTPLCFLHGNGSCFISALTLFGFLEIRPSARIIQSSLLRQRITFYRLFQTLDSYSHVGSPP